MHFYVWRCCRLLMFLQESHCATPQPGGPGWKNTRAVTFSTLKLISFCSLPSSFILIFQPAIFHPTPLPTPRLWEVSGATSSWLPNMKRFPKVQDSSLISSGALRLPASPALLRLSLSIHLPLLALSPAAHLFAPFTSNTAGPWHTC